MHVMKLYMKCVPCIIQGILAISFLQTLNSSSPLHTFLLASVSLCKYTDPS